MISLDPKIVCFLCNWAVDEEELAKNRSLNILTNVNFVPVKCVGRIDPVNILDTFLKGVDGVLIVGCASPDCHFIEGNVYAELMVDIIKRLLFLSNYETDRLELISISPLEKGKFVKIVENFEDKLSDLNRSYTGEEKKDENIMENILAARNASKSFFLRAFMGKEKELLNNKNAYNEGISREEFTILLENIVKTEFLRHKILLSFNKKPFSVKDLANSIGMKPSIVFRHILNMRRKGMIALDHIDGTTPLYKPLEVN